MPDRRLDVWEKLADPEAVPLLEAAAIAVADGITPASVMRLRKSFPGTSVAEAIELASARARADAKFADPSAMMLDRAGLEQATSETVAEWKAARFGDSPVLDLCLRHRRRRDGPWPAEVPAPWSIAIRSAGGWPD